MGRFDCNLSDYKQQEASVIFLYKNMLSPNLHDNHHSLQIKLICYFFNSVSTMDDILSRLSHKWSCIDLDWLIFLGFQDIKVIHDFLVLIDVFPYTDTINK
jgi:hypothetical protein